MKPNSPARRWAWRGASWTAPLVLTLVLGGGLLIRAAFGEYGIYGIAFVYMILPLVIVCGLFLSVVALLLLVDKSTRPKDRVGKIIWSGDEKYRSDRWAAP